MADVGPVTGSSGPLKTPEEYSIADGGASPLSTISAGVGVPSSRPSGPSESEMLRKLRECA